MAVARRILGPSCIETRSSGNRKSVKGTWLSEIPDQSKNCAAKSTSRKKNIENRVVWDTSHPCIAMTPTHQVCNFHSDDLNDPEEGSRMC